MQFHHQNVLYSLMCAFLIVLYSLFCAFSFVVRLFNYQSLKSVALNFDFSVSEISRLHLDHEAAAIWDVEPKNLDSYKCF